MTMAAASGRGATPPIEFGGDPAVAESVLTGEFRAVTAEEAAELSALCPTDLAPELRAEHSRDWWPLAMRWSLANRLPRRAEAVCTPRDTAEVSALLAWCNERGIPVTTSGGRSGVCGAAVPVHGGIVLSTAAMQGVLNVDVVSGIVEVLPGTYGPDLEDELAGHGVTVGHYPQSFDISTVGGWVACRGAGQYSTRYGKIEDMVHALEAVLADGSVVRTGGAPAGATGPDLTQLLVGSEGTLAVVTRVWLRAHPRPEHERRAAYEFDTFADGIEACRRIIRAGATPAVLRLYDGAETKRSHGGDGTRAMLLVLDEGPAPLVDAVMAVTAETCAALGARAADVGLVEKWLGHRNDTSGLQALTRRGFVVDTMEVAAPWARLEGIVEAVEAALLAVPHARAATCHLSHSYIDGACLYFTFAASPPEDVFDATYHDMWTAGQHAALAAGANLSHHHGVGLSRARFMDTAMGSTMDVLRRVKSALDPRGILNPGKLGL
jgi:alkyldihydroxyacetonephosphate synthase